MADTVARSRPDPPKSGVVLERQPTRIVTIRIETPDERAQDQRADPTNPGADIARRFLHGDREERPDGHQQDHVGNGHCSQRVGHQRGLSAHEITSRVQAARQHSRTASPESSSIATHWPSPPGSYDVAVITTLRVDRRNRGSFDGIRGQKKRAWSMVARKNSPCSHSGVPSHQPALMRRGRV